eukprot:scaffold106998_cov60-Phaeocystis_antarctica.AAC.5
MASNSGKKAANNLVRHTSACPASSAFTAGTGHSAAARSKCSTHFLSSVAERGPASQATVDPRSTPARITLAFALSGAALITLADSALSPSSFHHSGLATSAHTSDVSIPKPNAAASAHHSEPTGQRSLASRSRCAASTTCPELESTAPRPWLLCASPPWRGTAGHQRAALRSRRPSAQRSGPASPHSRDPAAAPPLHPPSPSAAPSPACDTPRAASKHQGSPDS